MSYKIINKQLCECTCERCGNKWDKDIVDDSPIEDKLPKSCSKCKSKYWNKPRKQNGK